MKILKLTLFIICSVILLSGCKENDKTPAVMEEPSVVIDQHWQAFVDKDFKMYKDSFSRESEMYKQVNKAFLEDYRAEFRKVTEINKLEWKLLKEIPMAENLQKKIEKEGYHPKKMKTVLVSIPSIHEKSWTFPSYDEKANTVEPGNKETKTVVEGDKMVYVLKAEDNKWKIFYQISEHLYKLLNGEQAEEIERILGGY